METKNKLLYLILFVLFPIVTFAQNSPAPTKIALIIGNNNYAGNSMFTKLNNCERDADSMARALRQLGFDYIVKKNLTLMQTLDALDDFRKKAKGKDIALVYYSGHGIQDRGRNYLIPVDCQFDTDKDRNHLDNYACNVQSILNYYNEPSRTDKVNILIVDACRNSVYYSKAPTARTADISGLSIYDNTFVAFSTNSGNESSDNFGKQNGLFTQELLKNIKMPIAITEIMRQTKNTVVGLSNGAQIPSFTDHLSTPYYFTETDKDFKVVYTPASTKTTSGSGRSGTSLNNSILIIPRQPDFTSISNMLNDPAMRSVISHLSSILEDKNVNPAYYDFTSNANMGDDKKAILKKSGAKRSIEVDITMSDDGTGANAATVMLRGLTADGNTIFTKRYSSPYFRTNDIGVLAIRALKDKEEELFTLFTK